MTGGDTPAASGTTAATQDDGEPDAARAARRDVLGTVEDVRLAKLEQQWPAPGDSRRNPFTMAAAPPPPSAPTASAPAKPADAAEVRRSRRGRRHRRRFRRSR